MDAEPPDPEVELRAALAAIALPRPDIGQVTRLLQEAQRQLAALDGHTLAASRANSLDSALHHGAQAVMAAEAAGACLLSVIRELGTARTAAHAAEQASRHALGAAMAGTGCLIFPLEHHNVEAAPGSPRVEIEQAAALPSQFWRDREPEPDKPRIAAALKHGPVPGARLARGPASVRIVSRKGLPE